MSEYRELRCDSNTVIRKSVCNQQKNTIWTCLELFTVCVSVLSGHALPSVSCGGEAAGDKATDVSAQEGTKSVLVMSGGEGYIDFRMGECAPRTSIQVTALP